MFIAQLSVAGEVQTCLRAQQNSSIPEDRQALDDFACDRSNLPWIIFRAAHRASHMPALPVRARCLLAALARTVDAARPFAAIFASRELLTGRAMQSMRTFYRSLDDLESAGLITRPPQTRYGAAGLFGRAYLHLTDKAAVVLGLVEPTQQAVSEEVNAHQNANHTVEAPFLVTPSASVADRAIYKDLNPVTQKRQPDRVPADLTRLRALGFRDFLIYKLMREARLHAKRLSDVVEATWEHLRRVHHPISYLRALLRAPVDFAYRACSQQAVAATESANRTRRREAHDATASLAGREFLSGNGMSRFFVSADAASVIVRREDEPLPRQIAGEWAIPFMEALRAGRIVPAQSPRLAHVIDPQALTAESSRHTAAIIRQTPKSAVLMDDLKRYLRMKQAEVEPTSPSTTKVAGSNGDDGSPLELAGL